MFYILNENIALRSYKLVPYCFLAKHRSTAIGLEEEEFKILLKCDGKHELEYNDIIQNLLKRNLIKECQKGELKLTQWQKHLKCRNRYIPMMNIQITGKCNYNCKHCFNCQDNLPLQSEISYENMLKLLSDCTKCGITSFTITGGEPMMHPYFKEILSEIYKRNMFIFELNTNGYFINEDILDFMLSINCKPLMKISFDGIGFHNWMRGNVLAEEKTISAIKLCIKKGFEVKVQLNVNKLNVDSIYPTTCFLDELGVKSTRIIKTIDTPRWVINSQDRGMNFYEYYDFALEFLKKYRKDKHNMNIILWQLLTYNPTSDYHSYDSYHEAQNYRLNQPICRSVRSMVAVASDGEVYPCMQMQGYMNENNISFGNVFKEGLANILKEGLYIDTICRSLQDKLNADSKCKTCDFFGKCLGGYPCLAVLLYGGDIRYYLKEDRSKCIFLKEGYLEKFETMFKE